MGRWIGMLLAETGSSTDPGALHYDYIDVEMTASVIQAAKQTFWWEAFGCFQYYENLYLHIKSDAKRAYQIPSASLPDLEVLKCLSIAVW